MKRTLPGILLTLMVVAVACGGGGDDVTGGGGGSSSTISASFTADQPAPVADDVAMAQGNRSGNRVTVRVNVTETNGLFGASFEVSYNRSRVSFEGWSAGEVLESGGNNPNYTVSASGGRVVVGASRTGGAPGVNVNGTRTLINLTFRVTEMGSQPIEFLNPVLFDDQLNPAPLPGISWHAGDLVGS